MNTMTVELEFSPQQLAQLDQLAQTRQILVDETIQLAVNEWLEKQARLAQARQKMRKLGQGLGASAVSGAVADNHDMHLPIESVLRHQQWQEDLDRNEFYDETFA